MRYYRSTDKRKKTLSDWPTLLATFSICLLCWIVGFISLLGFPLTTDDSALPFLDQLFQWLDNRILVYLIGFLFMILIAFIIQRISDIEMLIRERTRIVFLLFVLLISTDVNLLPFKEVTIVLLCLVFMINELFKAYQAPEATGKMFNTGVLIGISGLFMPQALWFTPLLWIGMYHFLSLSYRSFVASLIGVLIIYWFVLAWCVWTHDFSIFASLYASLTDFDFMSAFLSFRHFQIGLIGVVLLMILAFVSIQKDAINNRVRVRQMLSFLLIMSVWSLVLICLYGSDAHSFLAVFYIPVSVLIAYFFENMRSRFRFLLYYFILALSAVSFILKIWNY
jgi:hypothetical protein